MSSAKTTYLSNKLLDHNLKHVSYTSPTTVYLALFTVTPSVSGGGTEVAGGSYARQAISFNTASTGTSTSSATITFPANPAATIVALGIYDASTSGNLLYFQTLTSIITTSSGDDLSFPSGNIIVAEA